MKPVLWIDVVGLTPRQIGPRTPRLRELSQRGALAPLTTVLPAVTCSAQASLLTGLPVRDHGAVGNGWFDRESGEVALWRQSNALVKGRKVYERARELDAGFRCAKLFWWWNLGAAIDFSITPRPYYPADGRKIPAIYASPTAYGVELEKALGSFPFFDFWGPKSGLPSSRWIADAALRTLERERPTLTLVYLPHLDYDHQRYGPSAPRSQAALGEIDAIVGDLLDGAKLAGAEVVIVSEYGLCEVDQPVHLNRALREAGLLAVRETPTGEVLDVFASRAFAVADHQVAHVYARTPEAEGRARRVLEGLSGVERVLDRKAQAELALDHSRAGELVAVAAPRAWFTYYYWLDDARAPDFAPTVDIHRKPGYDPCELFVDPHLSSPKLRIATRLLQKKLGMRYLMDVIPLDAGLVKGSHGRLPADPLDGPVYLSTQPFASAHELLPNGSMAMTAVAERVLALLCR